jgi:lipid-A-disaccharide synthase
MKYYLIAGEASGDLHGSNLMKAIKETDPGAEFRFFGGDLMAAAGGTLVKHYREMAFMGFADVLANIRTILGNMRTCKRDILNFGPDALILIDYAGFNLRIASFSHKKKIKTFFYISPKVWAWKKKRIIKLKKYIDRLFVIFPFEVQYFKDNDLEVEFYGNPLMDSIDQFRNSGSRAKDFSKENGLSGKPVIALLSGSRRHEISRLLPEMMAASARFPNYEFVVAGAPSVPAEFYESFLAGTPVRIVYGKTYELLENAYSAVVTSGTATLETALFRVPQVVVFKTGGFTYFLGSLFVKVRFFSLVNLIAQKEVVKELLQFNLARDISTELSKICTDIAHRNAMLEEYDRIIALLGGPGTSKRIAKRIWELAGKA